MIVIMHPISSQIYVMFFVQRTMCFVVVFTLDGCYMHPTCSQVHVMFLLALSRVLLIAGNPPSRHRSSLLYITCTTPQ